MKVKIVVAGLWIVSLIGSAALTAHAQRTLRPAGKGREVVAGPEVGFRIDRYNGETPVGELVVKRDGTWIAVQFGAAARPAR